MKVDQNLVKCYQKLMICDQVLSKVMKCDSNLSNFDQQLKLVNINKHNRRNNTNLKLQKTNNEQKHDQQ